MEKYEQVRMSQVQPGDTVKHDGKESAVLTRSDAGAWIRLVLANGHEVRKRSNSTISRKA